MMSKYPRASLLLLLSWTLPGQANHFPDCSVHYDSVSRIDHSDLDDETNNAPTPAPSSSHPCSTRTSNARGKYHTSKAPCVFQFHKSSRPEIKLIDFQTSDLCSEDDAFLTVKEYINEGWPDECVGDFQRCYSLQHHQAILQNFLCRHNWQVPEGTTHMSVDCTEDKTLVTEATFQEKAQHIKEEQEHRLETYEIKLFNWGLIFIFCVTGIFVLSQLLIKPVVGSLAAACSQHRSTNNNNNEDGATTSTPQETQDLVNNHNSSHQESFDQNDSDAVVEQDHFDMQVPLDFDAVPIVPATVLHE